MEAANRLLLLGSQLPGQARAGVQTLLVQSGRPWENCANVGSSLGATGPPEKTLWACYRGRKTGTGTGQAEEEKPPGKVAFPYPPTCLASCHAFTRDRDCSHPERRAIHSGGAAMGMEEGAPCTNSTQSSVRVCADVHRGLQA